VRFESRRGQNEKKTHFAIQKDIFSLLLFDGWSLYFTFERRFVELEKAFL
jgi:hypothetical protein